MKIFFYSGQFYPKIVGSGTVAYLIAKELAKRGHEITVAVDKEIQLISKKTNYPFTVLYLDSLKEFATGATGLRKATTEIYYALKSQKFDIVHVYSFMPMLLISLMRDLIDCPVIFTFWNTPNKNERAIGFYNEPELDLQLARSIVDLKKYDRVIVGSEAWRGTALSLGINPEILDFSYIGIDLSEFKYKLKRNKSVDIRYYFGDKLKPNDVLITLPARITEQKGILEAIEALSIVNQTIPAKLLLTGMINPYKKEFANKILDKVKALGLSDQILIPLQEIKRNHMSMIYQRSDIVITPSYYEGLGLSAIEALASSRPLVATSVAGLNEIAKHGYNSLIVPPYDSKKLAEAIVRLLKDKNLASSLSSKGPESVKKFDIRNFVDFLEISYLKLTSK